MFTVSSMEVVQALGYLTSGSDRPVGRTLEFLLVRYRSAEVSARFAVTADLQGREREKANRLLGCRVAEELLTLQKQGIAPPLDFCALCGDFYDYPDCHKRGGTGDVSNVLNAFGVVAPTFAVLGNHDEVLGVLDPIVRILEGSSVTIGGVKLGGVGGIVGDPKKNQRKSEADFLDAVMQVLSERPNLLLLHAGPEGPTERHRGWGELNGLLSLANDLLVVFGHTRWPEPLHTENSNLFCNVDGRVLIFVPET